MRGRNPKIGKHREYKQKSHYGRREASSPAPIILDQTGRGTCHRTNVQFGV